MSILIRRYLNRSKAAGDLTEEWQVGHEMAMLTYDVEQMVEECLELSGLAKTMWNEVAEDFFDGEIEDVDKCGRLLKLAFNKGHEVFNRILGIVEQAEECEYSIRNASKLRLSIDEVEAMKKEFEKAWPVANPEMAKKALEEYIRGECVSFEELFAHASYAGPATRD